MFKHLDLSKHVPVRVIIDDCGDQFSGWPSIVSRDEADTTLIHRAGFKQEYWGDLSQRQAVELANEIARLINEAHGEKQPKGPPYIWAGQCLKCGDCFEWETAENKPPLHDEEGKSIGALCPSCRERGLKLVGVVHFLKRIEDFVPERVHPERL